MRKIKNIIWNVLNLTKLGPFLQLYLVGYILETGWYRSFQTKSSIDSEGNPIPWFTYPFTTFLESRLNKNLSVFEYGCGASTNWFAKRVKCITSVEDNKEWFDYVKSIKASNVTLLLRSGENFELYASTILDFEPADVIIVDGKFRNECINYAIENLSPQTVLILDDSHRDDYLSATQKLVYLGFKRIDFWGMHPTNARNSCTTVFYTKDNCLKI